TYDIYLHFLMYDALRRVLLGRVELNFSLTSARDASVVYLPATGVLTALGVEESVESWARGVVPAIHALVREDLLNSQGGNFGPPDFLAQQVGVGVAEGGLTFAPSVSGLELFCWAHGHGDGTPNSILDPEIPFERSEDLRSVDGAVTVDALRQVPVSDSGDE